MICPTCHRPLPQEPGRKPYGDRPGELKTLERMRQLRIEGLTLDAIAADLNEKQMFTRYGKAWNLATIAKILNRD